MGEDDVTWPTDPEELLALTKRLHGELGMLKDELKAARLRNEKYEAIIARYRRMQFGPSSERYIGQLALDFGQPAEDATPPKPALAPANDDRKTHPVRRPLPAHLPRETVRHEPDGCRCTACGGALHVIGEDSSEVLDYIPGHFKVIRHVRPRFGCRTCETVVQEPAPSLPILRGLPGPGLLAQVLVSKYCDHLPLYRQARIYGRAGVDIDRGTMVGWVGRSASLLKPLSERIAAHVFAADKVHTDDTPLPVLAPGNGKTVTGRMWIYVRDGRPYRDTTPPAAVFFYSPDRRGKRPAEHLKTFKGFLQADAYGGYDQIYRQGQIVEVACWAHARRQVYDAFESTKSPIAEEALRVIGELYKIERRIRGEAPDVRLASRQAESVPILERFHEWTLKRRAELLPQSGLSRALGYILAQWTALMRYTTDGRLEIDNNRAENTIRGISLGRKNYLFMGSDAGGDYAATLYTLIESCKLGGIEPFAYLRDVLGGIADHPINRIDELLPWAWAERQTAQSEVAA